MRVDKRVVDDRSGPLVSVIMPVYQGEKVVRGAVRSVLRQTYRNIELLVVDDGSQDRTSAIVAEIDDPRLRVLRQTNGGTASARNLAIRHSSGAYVAFLDSDDRWFPRKLTIELGVLARLPAAPAIVYSSYYPVDDRGRLLNAPKKIAYQGNLFDVLLDTEDFLVPSACLFDRRVFDKIGSFEVAHYHEDHEFILRAARFFPVYPTRQVLVVYRQSTTGKCRAILKDFERARYEEQRIVTAIESYATFDERERLLRNVNRSLYCRFLMYGFDRNARAILGEVELKSLRGNKGRLALIFAKTGVNVLAFARACVQVFYRFAMQGRWKKILVTESLNLDYDGPPPFAREAR